MLTSLNHTTSSGPWCCRPQRAIIRDKPPSANLLPCRINFSFLNERQRAPGWFTMNDRCSYRGNGKRKNQENGDAFHDQEAFLQKSQQCDTDGVAILPIRVFRTG